MTNWVEKQLRVFERKMLRTIFRPKKMNDKEYRVIMNHDILKAIGEEDIVKDAKA